MASLDHLRQKHLADVLIDYVSWRSRYVGARRRTVEVEGPALADAHWLSKSAAVEAFLSKVTSGDDLTPYLSLQPHTRGFTPAALAPGASSEEKWSDKDFVLNVTGFHHFHFGTTIEKGGHAARTDELIFARVTRDEFVVVALFDHTVFDHGSAERLRLLSIHDEHVGRGAAPGQIVIRSAITTSGHDMGHVFFAKACVRALRQVDPKLDDPELVAGFYKTAALDAPKKPNLEWHFNHLDLGFFDRATGAFFTVLKGRN
jgi:hypothetical protein